MTSKHHRGPAKVRRYRWYGVCAALLVATALSLWPVTSTFHFEGQTERISALIAGSSLSWHLNNALLFVDHSAISTAFSGSYQPSDGEDVLIQRVSLGSLRIRCKAANGRGLGSLSSEDVTSQVADIVARGHEVVFVLNDIDARMKQGDSVVIPLTGITDIGNAGTTGGEGTIPLTRSGQVRILGHSLLGESTYNAGTEPVSLGDSLILDRSIGIATGLATVDERAGLNVVLGFVAPSIRIVRFRSQGYKVETTLPERIKGDAAVQGVWILFLAMVALSKWIFPQADGGKE